MARANIACGLPSSAARVYASYASSSRPSPSRVSASIRAPSRSSSPRWDDVSASLAMRPSQGSCSPPSRVPSTEFQHRMHLSYPMSTPYLYHLAASIGLASRPFSPYSKLRPMSRNSSASPVSAVEEYHISASEAERSTPEPVAYMRPTENFASGNPCSAALLNSSNPLSSSLSTSPPPLTYWVASSTRAETFPRSADIVRCLRASSGPNPVSPATVIAKSSQCALAHPRSAALVYHAMASSMSGSISFPVWR